MSDPRDTPGWTQQREPPDDSECTLLRSMYGKGYVVTEADLNETYCKLGGAEHIEMIEDLERRGFCSEEGRDGGIAWILTEQGRKAIGL